jgi:hypothetical protein
MAIQRMIPNAQHVSEFDAATNGERHNGTCTQAAAAVCLASVFGQPTTHQALVDLFTSMTDWMIEHGTAQASGAASVVNMANEMRRRGAQVTVHGYQEPLGIDWQGILAANAGAKPLLLQVAKASNLADAQGNHPDAGVDYHALAIVGLADDGYVVSDPNNPAVDASFAVYPVATLAAALPCGLIITEPAPHDLATLPPGWHDDGTTLVGPISPVDQAQYIFQGGMRDHALAELRAGLLAADDTAIENERHLADGTRIEQCTVYSCLVFQRNAGGAWEFFRSNLGVEHQKHRPLPPVAPAPPPKPTPNANKVKLARVQQALGIRTVGIYFGIWTAPARQPQFADLAAQAKALGFDYAMVKFGEAGTLWYDGTELAIKQAFAQHQLPLVPYYYCRPNFATADRDSCIRLAREFGVIDLNVEEVFLHHGTELYAIVQGIRAAVPEAVIIADGYGDPVTAFGHTFPFDALADADCYQPQWYESFIAGGLPGALTAAAWLDALNKHDAECGEEFIRCKLGLDFPIRPCIDLASMNVAVAEAVGAWCAKFQAGVMCWEFHTVPSAEVVAALKHGLGA